MAVTKIKPIRTTIDKSIAYICNPKKTENCMYVYSENSFPETAAVEFQFYQQQARAGGNTLGRHLIQSFAPGEVSTEMAHALGKKLVDEILGGEYAYILATHVDRDHIHNHFIWCAVNIKTNKRYVSSKRTYHKIQEVSDRLCVENSLSVVTEPKGVGKSFSEYRAEKAGNSWKAKLRLTIDESILSADNYDDFLQKMQDAGYEIKRGKHISFRASGQERFTRSKTIGEDYSEERITERIREAKTQKTSPETAGKTPPKRDDDSIRSLITIDGSDKIKSSYGLTQWAKVQNLKISAQSLVFLQNMGINSVEEFEGAYAVCNKKCNEAKQVLYETKKAIIVLEALTPTDENLRELKRLRTLKYQQEKEYSKHYKERWELTKIKANLSAALGSDRRSGRRKEYER